MLVYASPEWNGRGIQSASCQVISFFIFRVKALQSRTTQLYLAEILQGLGENPAEREVTITVSIPLKDT